MSGVFCTGVPLQCSPFFLSENYPVYVMFFSHRIVFICTGCHGQGHCRNAETFLLRGNLMALLQLPERRLLRGEGWSLLSDNSSRTRGTLSRGGSGWILGEIPSPEER